MENGVLLPFLGLLFDTRVTLLLWRPQHDLCERKSIIEHAFQMEITVALPGCSLLH